MWFIVLNYFYLLIKRNVVLDFMDTPKDFNSADVTNWLMFEINDNNCPVIISVNIE